MIQRKISNDSINLSIQKILVLCGNILKYYLECMIREKQEVNQLNSRIKIIMKNNKLFSLIDYKIHFICTFSFYLNKLIFKFREACVSFISFFDFRQINHIRERKELAINTSSTDNENLIYFFRFELFHHIFNTIIRF